MTQKFVIEFRVSEKMTAHDVQIKLAMMARLFSFDRPLVLGEFTEEEL